MLIDARFTGGPLNGQVRPIWAGLRIFQVAEERRRESLHLYTLSAFQLRVRKVREIHEVERENDPTVLGLVFSYVGLVPR